VSFTAFVLPAADGQRLCIHHPAAGQTARGAIVYLHPFAEEMNKSRRMAALQSRAMAAAGYEVLQIDLLGCGDSSGDFGDATWAAWLEDAKRAIAWLRQRCSAPLWLWGLRTGALLAAEAARRTREPAGLLLWNPVVSGKQYLQQFLRLKLASEALAGDGKGAMAAMRQSLAAGAGVEVAGYRLSSTLAAEIEALELTAGPAVRALRWLETSSRSDPTLTPATQACVDRLRRSCADVRALAVNGPAFWQTTEIEEAPELVCATLEELAASA
jgi:exosortase A-associated hydrolase 2